MEPLQRVYDDVVRERDRLRDARRAVTSQLGPLPAASAVIVGLFAALSDDVDGRLPTVLFVLALALFLLMNVISMRAIGYKPYRELRDELLPDEGLDGKSESEWLAEMIHVERELMTRLEGAFEKERRFLLAVQCLLALQVLLLAVIPLSAPGP
jgi:hypothetical protein